MTVLFVLLLFVLGDGSVWADPEIPHGEHHVATALVTDISGAVISVEHESLAGPGIFLIFKERPEVFFWTLADAKVLLSRIQLNPDAQEKLNNLTVIRTFLNDKKFLVDVAQDHDLVTLFKYFLIEPKKLSDLGVRWSVALPVVVRDGSFSEEAIERFVDLSCLDQTTGDVLTNPECMAAQRLLELNARCSGTAQFPFLYVLPEVKDPLLTSKKKIVKVPAQTPLAASSVSFGSVLTAVGSVGLVVGGLVVALSQQEAQAIAQKEQERVEEELKRPASVPLGNPRRVVTPPLDKGFFVLNESPLQSPRYASPIDEVDEEAVEPDLTSLDPRAIEGDLDEHFLPPKKTWIFQKPSFRGKHPDVILKRCCAIYFELHGKKWCFTADQCRLAWQALEAKKNILKKIAAQEFNAIIFDCMENNTDSYWQQVIDLFKLLGQEPTECS